MISDVVKWGEFVKLSHTVFALPFAPAASEVLPTTLRFEALLEFLLNLYLLSVLTASERESVIGGLAKLLEEGNAAGDFVIDHPRMLAVSISGVLKSLEFKASKPCP